MTRREPSWRSTRNPWPVDRDYGPPTLRRPWMRYRSEHRSPDSAREAFRIDVLCLGVFVACYIAASWR